MPRLIAALAMTLLLWLPQQVRATCTFDTSDGQMPRIRIPNVTWDGAFNPNAFAVGDIIKNIMIPMNPRWFTENPIPGETYGRIICPPYPGLQTRKGTTGTPQLLNVSALGGVVSVYPSTVPGVGIVFDYDGLSYSRWPVTRDFTGQSGPDFLALTSGTYFYVRLIKTGPITSGGVLSGEAGGWFQDGHGGQQVASFVWSGGGLPIVPTVPTCVPTVADKVVDLGNVDAGSVAADGYSNSVAFDMDVLCSGGNPADKTQQMSVTFTDATDTTNTTDKLTLTSASTATGVKVQLLQGGTPVTFGPEPTNGADTTYSRALGTIQNGTYSFPLAARYVKTGSTVTAGSANAIATFTYTYH